MDANTIRNIVKCCKAGQCNFCPLYVLTCDEEECQEAFFKYTLQVLDVLEEENASLKRQLEKGGSDK